MEACRLALLDQGYTFSAKVSTNVDLNRVQVQLENRETGPESESGLGPAE